MLQYARQTGCAWDASTCAAAARGGHLAVLQYAHWMGCDWRPKTCSAAAGGGHLAVLQFAHQNGCAWHSSTSEAAAGGGHLAVLQYARQNGCEWGPTVCSAAAKHGHLNILKWLRLHGCPWDSHTSYQAAANNKLELFEGDSATATSLPSVATQGASSVPPKLRPTKPLYACDLLQQQAHLHVSHSFKARAAATRMTCAVLSLRAALPNRTPHEVVLGIVNLAFS